MCALLFFLLVPDDLDVFSVLALAVPPLSVHDGRVHVGRGESVGLVQQRDHTEQDGPERDVREWSEIKIQESNTGGGQGNTGTQGGERKMEVRRDKRH